MIVKVTGYLHPAPDETDPDHETGLTEEAFLEYSSTLGLDDLTFEKIG